MLNIFHAYKFRDERSRNVSRAHGGWIIPRRKRASNLFDVSCGSIRLIRLQKYRAISWRRLVSKEVLTNIPLADNDVHSTVEQLFPTFDFSSTSLIHLVQLSGSNAPAVEASGSCCRRVCPLWSMGAEGQVSSRSKHKVRYMNIKCISRRGMSGVRELI